MTARMAWVLVGLFAVSVSAFGQAGGDRGLLVPVPASLDTKAVERIVARVDAELAKGGIRRARIGRVGSYEKIEVLGKARLRMQANGVASETRYLTPWAWKADKSSL